MTCPLCSTRKARRPCPALEPGICPVCCGTKRLVEIRCPDDCGYLSSARAHPAASCNVSSELDVALLAADDPTGLTDRQSSLFFFLSVDRAAARRRRASPVWSTPTSLRPPRRCGDAGNGVARRHLRAQTPSLPAQELSTGCRPRSTDRRQGRARGRRSNARRRTRCGRSRRRAARGGTRRRHRAPVSRPDGPGARRRSRRTASRRSKARPRSSSCPSSVLAP